MTVQPLSGFPIYTVSGTGPYAVQFGFSQLAHVRLSLLENGIWVDMEEGDWALTAATPSPTDTYIGGAITLTSAAATTLAGHKIRPYRLTQLEQGWRGIGAREVGNERQHDATARAVQELQDQMARTLRMTGVAFPFHPTPGALIVFNAESQPVSGPDSEVLLEGVATIEANVTLSQEARAAAEAAAGQSAAHRDTASGHAADAGNQAAAAASSAAGANTSLLALGQVLVNGIGAFSVNADGELVVQYNDLLIDDMEIDADGNFLITYEVS